MMHRERMKPKYSLEDYIYDMEARSLEPSVDTENLDVYARLQQKENDLIYTAELGKALLEKNEELTRQNEKLVEEYCQKLELVEQDRHLLKRKLLETQSECDTRILELQGDIKELNATLESADQTSKQTEREKAALIQELTEQNTRLTNQLKESSRTEAELSAQLQGLRDQCNLKKSSLQDHVSSLDVLREEIMLMSEKKAEMERKLQSLITEREGLASALDEATDRIVMLEHQAREHELQLRHSHREVEELSALNGSMSDRIEALSNHGSSPGTTAGHRSLLMEMECDDISDSDMPPSDADQLHNLRVEILATYHQLRHLCEDLRHKKGASESSDADSSMSSEEITAGQVQAGLLTEVVKELLRIIDDLTDRRDSNMSTTSGLEMELELGAELHRVRELLEKTQRQLEEKEEEHKRKSNQIMELNSKLSVRDAELSAAREEVGQARSDLSGTALAQDEVVRKAWDVRDAAVARKNIAEVELAKTRIDVMQSSSQLMEAIQQKVELSQQLEQWQMDMQSLLDDQMKRKLTKQELRMQQINNANETANTKKPARGLFGLFQR